MSREILNYFHFSLNSFLFKGIVAEEFCKIFAAAGAFYRGLAMKFTSIAFVCLQLTLFCAVSSGAQSQKPDETPPLVDKPSQNAAPPKQPTAAEMAAKETVASALLRGLDYEEYQLRSAAMAMPAEKYSWRPVAGNFGGVNPGYGPTEMRTFGEQVKHVACANFGFSEQLDGKPPTPNCDQGGPSPAKARDELIVYLRDSFKAVRKSLGAITQKNMFDPIEGLYDTPNTRLGVAHTVIWHCADHYGQLAIYMRLNAIVPPASRPDPPKLKD
jgi:hypothetical protein